MTDDSAAELVTFETVNAVLTLAKLGVVRVGEIYQGVPPLAPTFTEICWRVFLPDAPEVWRPVRDQAQARDQLRAAVGEWLEAADLAPATRRAAEIRAFRMPSRQARKVPA